MGSLGLISDSVRTQGVARFRDKNNDRKDVLNGRYLNRKHSERFLGSGGDGSTRYGHARASEREPGELSSDSGSDNDSGRHTRRRYTGNFHDGDKRPDLEKIKRKISPIIWNSDEGVRNVKHRISQRRDTASASTRSVSPLASVEGVDEVEENHMGSNIGAKVLGEDERVSTPSINACRWANDVESPADEGEIYDAEETKKRKNPERAQVNKAGKSERMKSIPGYSKTMEQRKSVTPEFGEPREEGCQSKRVRSSDEGTRPSSCCTYQDDLDKNDMEIYMDHKDAAPSFSNTDGDFGDICNLHESPDRKRSPSRSVSMLQGCRSIDEFQRLNKINEGTYGVVYRAKDKNTGEIVALKKVKMEKEREGFPLTALREINILLSFHHPSIVRVKEVVVGSDLDSIFLSMEYMDHDLRGIIETMKQPFSQSEVKCLMLQLLEGVKCLHDNWILHRDLKSSNLLLNNHGELKICDFGLARQYGSPLKPYTSLVVTLWYRAPELLLGAKEYSTAIDMWSVGCIMAELLSKKPLFCGKTELDQLDKIFRILGMPNEDIWPGFLKLPGAKPKFVKHRYNRLREEFPATSFIGSPVLSDAGFRLLNSLLTYDPKQRITASDALKHEWFSEYPLPKERELMPVYHTQQAPERSMRRVMKSPDPLEEQHQKELQQRELQTGGLFA